MSKHVPEIAEHDHPQSKLMVVMMLGCVAIGAIGLFYPNYWLDVAFVVSMGACVGHHLWHRLRHRRGTDE